MTLTPFSEEILAWLRQQACPGGHTLDELSQHFGYPRERMRDHLRRLVDAGLLRQSDPVAGFADANPSYRITDVTADPS